MKTRVKKYRKYLYPYERKYLKILIRVCRGVLMEMERRAGTSRTHIKRLLRRHKLYKQVVAMRRY